MRLLSPPSRAKLAALAFFAVASTGCSHEETRLDRLARAGTVQYETSGGETPTVPDLFHGRVGMSWVQVDAACTEGGGELTVVQSDIYQCAGLDSPFRMQRTELVETYLFDSEQRCEAAYYEIRMPANGVIRYQTRRYSPLYAARLMFQWVVDAVNDSIPLERKSSIRYQSDGKWVRVVRDNTTVIVEVGLPQPR